MSGLGSGITIALLVIVGVVLLLVAIIWSMKRHRSPTLRVECNDSIRGARAVVGRPDAQRGDGRQCRRSLREWRLLRCFDRRDFRGAGLRAFREFPVERGSARPAHRRRNVCQGTRGSHCTRTGGCNWIQGDGENRRAAADGVRLQARQVPQVAYPQYWRDE